MQKQSADVVLVIALCFLETIQSIASDYVTIRHTFWVAFRVSNYIFIIFGIERFLGRYTRRQFHIKISEKSSKLLYS